MSADNWTLCPKCQPGDIEHAGYADLHLREDYEIGIVDGIFGIEYRCYCYKCKYQFIFNHSEESCK